MLLSAEAMTILAVIAVVLPIFGVAAWYARAGTPLSPDGTNEPSTSAEWTLLVDGFVDRPLNLSLDEIASMPRTTVSSEIYCMPAPGSSGVLVESGNWTGVRLRLILQTAVVSSDAVKVAFYANDGFITDLDISTAMHDDVILAYEKDGKPSRDKLRLIVPGYYGYKWIKYLMHIELMDYDFRGTYESRGFPDDAKITEGK